MAVRTTATAVKAILLNQFDLSNDPSLTAFIDAAAIIIKRVETCDSDSILDEDDKEMIERWLAAHLYAHADQLMKSKTTGDASASFQGTTGMGLESTQYGQTAMTLDASGCLSEINRLDSQGGTVTCGATWLGKPVSSQIDYGDRD